MLYLNRFPGNSSGQIINNILFCILFILFLSPSALTQSNESNQSKIDSSAKSDTVEHILQKTYYTQRIKNNPPLIDGILSDPCWDLVDWGTDFVQFQPYFGVAPTQKTAFKILYDDKNIYVGYRCYDTEPEKIVSRMSRRDGFEGDWVEINIDSYHDLRTAFSFTASVSGVKSDEFVTNDGNNWDTNWNPIWTNKTHIDSLGWTAEVAIPLSQLRFNKDEEQIWGIQFTRRDFRNESRSIWQKLPQNAPYWVSGFGELRGIKGIKPKRQIEIQPYVLAQFETFEKEEGNPFAKGTDEDFSVGLDGKIGITNDLTLDFTINPDFGQVEADPSVLTLDGFQVFFSERRPFFIENRNLFDYGVTQSVAGGPFNSDLLFYSRRIGAAPHHSVDGDSDLHKYVDQPEFTTILGAAKFSGKTKNGLSIGILESLTDSEHAVIDINGERSEEVIEPLTNFTVARLQQDINGGNTVIGGIFSSVNRDINDPALEFLHKKAYSGGIDFLHRWKDKKWRLDGRMIFSHVAGTEEAILETQTAFEHNFDRPDADHLELDSTATNLTGTGGNLAVGYYGLRFKFQTGLTYRSPELELNDIGFLRNTDEVNYYYWMGYRWPDPFSVFRYLNLNYNHWARWDFGGNNLYRAINVNTNTMFKNYWNLGTGITYDNLDISNNWLRGGPQFRKSDGIANNFWVNSDRRKKLSFSISGWHAYGFHTDIVSRNFGVTLRYQPSDAMNISFGPSWSKNRREDQYVSSTSFNQDDRYILGEVDQKTLSFTLRLNYNITPDLTIQYYGQPFISKGQYSRYSRVIDPGAVDFTDKVIFYTPEQLAFDAAEEIFNIDEDIDGTVDYTFDDPEFNFMQFRSNLVARWEYIPGSEIYFVWSQSTTNFGEPSDQLFTSLNDNLFGEKMHNIFLLKLTYRFLP